MQEHIVNVTNFTCLYTVNNLRLYVHRVQYICDSITLLLMHGYGIQRYLYIVEIVVKLLLHAAIHCLNLNSIFITMVMFGKSTAIVVLICNIAIYSKLSLVSLVDSFQYL